MNLRQLDLNLLPILQVLLQERHVSRAAEQLNMSQPAVSRALARLRQMLDDPLLVHTTQGYDLSARARILQPRLMTLMQNMEQLIQEPAFNPATDTSLIRLTGLDLELALYFPQLVRRMRQLAPNMRFETVRQHLDSFSMLDRDEVHFSFSGLQPVSAQGELHRIRIDSMPLRCVMADRHPLAQTGWTLENYAAAPHGLVSITGKGKGTMDQLLEPHGVQRQVTLRLSSFMSVADFCEDTDLIFTLPQRIAEHLSQGRRLCLRPLPEPLVSPQVNFYLYWHNRYHLDPRLRWIREQLSDIIQRMHHVPSPQD